MKTKFNGILTLLLALMVQITFAQEKTISGVVSDASGPLPGVSVVIKGTSKGTQTDFDGKYQIATKVGDVLTFSFVGMKTVAVNVGASNSINVSMQEDANALEEIIKDFANALEKESSTVVKEEIVTSLSYFLGTEVVDDAINLLKQAAKDNDAVVSEQAKISLSILKNEEMAVQ